MHHPSTSQSESSALAYMRARMAEADNMFRNGLAAAAHPSDILKLSRTLLDICTEVSDGLNSICKVSPVACRSGCDTCCRSLIQVNPIFARLALDYARRTFTPERLEMLHQRLLTDVTFCPFLFDGACSIYDQRPMVCRGYYSFDVALCQSGTFCENDLGYQGDEGHAAHQYRIFLFVLEKRIEDIEREFGIDPGPVFLHEAVRALWDDPQEG